MWDKQLRAKHRKMLSPKLTDANCRRPVNKVIEDYAQWAREQGLTEIHVFPVPEKGANRKRLVNARVAMKRVPGATLIEVEE